jgi:HD-GYP domain-containing protein (c-di-GMP phosphodiesterase class II)
MASVRIIEPTALKDIASSYVYDADTFHELEKLLWNRIRLYAGHYGQTVIEHLGRVAVHTEQLLIRHGYERQVAINIASAYRLHDAGKIMMEESIWNLDGKPSAEIRKQRLDHTALGPKLLEETLERFPKLAGHPHLEIMACLMLYHHERVDGTGPQKLHTSQLGEVLEIAGIADSVDGKTIPRPGKQASLTQALRDMTGLAAYTDKDKHRGEFRLPLLKSCIGYYQEFCNEWVLPDVAFATEKLA